MFTFLNKRECSHHNTIIRKAERKIEILQARKEKYQVRDEKFINDWEAGIWDSHGELSYGLWHNSLLSRISKQAVRDYRHRHFLRQTALFGQKLIVDLDYDNVCDALDGVPDTYSYSISPIVHETL